MEDGVVEISNDSVVNDLEGLDDGADEGVILVMLGVGQPSIENR